jgi:hypothetical protein
MIAERERSIPLVSRLGGTFCPLRLRCQKRGVQRTRDAGNDLILHLKQIAGRFIETIGPQVIAAFRID